MQQTSIDLRQRQNAKVLHHLRSHNQIHQAYIMQKGARKIARRAVSHGQEALRV